MTTLALEASLDELHDFLGKVRSFPVSVGQLLALARQAKAPKTVIKFYESFSADHIFNDQEDLVSCTEQVEILRQEGVDMPVEEERSPEED